MNLLAQPEFIREALAVWQALRRLGFSTGDIFAKPAEEEGGVFLIVLRVSGHEPIGFAVGEQTLSLADSVSRWSAASEVWNHAPADVLQEIWDRSVISCRGLELISILQEHGIAPPIVRSSLLN